MTGQAGSRRAARTMALALAAVVAGLALSACGGSGDAGTYATTVESGAVAPAGGAMVADGMSAETAPVPAKDAAAPAVPADGREVIRNGYVSVKVADVASSIGKVHALIAESNGIIASEDQSVSDQESGRVDFANVTAQIPAAGLDAFLDKVAGLGTVESLSVSAQDVTQQGVDLDARIKALQSSIDRLNSLLAQATKVDDLVSIEAALAQRQAELDSLVAQRTWLSQQVAMSSVTISLSPITTIANVEVPGFLSGLESGWSALVAAAKISLTTLGFVLPFLAIALIIGVPLAIWLVRRSRRRRAQPPVQPVTTPDDTSSVSRSGL